MASVSNKIKPHAHKGVIYSYIVYDIKLFKYIYDHDPMLGRSMSGPVNLIKNPDVDKYKYFEYITEFDTRGTFSFLGGSFGKSVIIFGFDMSSFEHIDNKNGYIIILGEIPTKGFDDITLTAEKSIA